MNTFYDFVFHCVMWKIFTEPCFSDVDKINNLYYGINNYNELSNSSSRVKGPKQSEVLKTIAI